MIKIVTRPNQKLLMTVELPDGKRVRCSLLSLLMSRSFPREHDKEQPQLSEDEPPLVIIPDAFKIRLIRRYEAEIVQAVHDVAASLRVHNSAYKKLVRQHQTYLWNMKAKNLGPLMHFVQGSFRFGQYRNESFSLELDDIDRVAFNDVKSSTLAAWKKKGFFFFHRKEKGVRAFRALSATVKRARSWPGTMYCGEEKQDQPCNRLNRVKSFRTLPSSRRRSCCPLRSGGRKTLVVF